MWHRSFGKRQEQFAKTSAMLCADENSSLVANSPTKRDGKAKEGLEAGPRSPAPPTSPVSSEDKRREHRAGTSFIPIIAQ